MTFYGSDGPPKPRVVGSIPASRTNKINDLAHQYQHEFFAGLRLGYDALFPPPFCHGQWRQFRMA